MAERITAIEALAHFENALAVEPAKARTDVPIVAAFVASISSGRAAAETIALRRPVCKRVPERLVG